MLKDCAVVISAYSEEEGKWGWWKGKSMRLRNCIMKNKNLKREKILFSKKI